MFNNNHFLTIILCMLFISCTNAPVQQPPQPVGVHPIQPYKVKPKRVEPNPPLQAPPIKTPIVKKSPFPVAQLPVPLLSLRNTSPVPGGIAWISLRNQSNSPPIIKYQNKRVLVLRNKQQWVALVGIPLTARSGQHFVIDEETKQRYSFQVNKKKYKVQKINIKNKRKVNPTPNDLQRIRREKQSIKSALATDWRPTTTSPLPLMKPISGNFKNSFGRQRYFNGQRRSSHTGLDISAPLGTPIGAAATGKVINTGEYFFTGNTVLIDHGQGVVTLYGHMNAIKVFPGQIVKTGEVIGTVGKTGRATGPHLHWGVSMNQNMIDPTLIMK